MKIGLFTYFAGCNFGENLQVYTSQQFFRSIGHEVWVINYRKDSIPYHYERYPIEQAVAHKSFVEKRLNLTKLLSQNDVLDYIIENEFDVVAFGADAIWNKRIREDLFVFTAQWLNGFNQKSDLKVICISPAFMGNTYSELSNEEKDSFKKGLENFTYINVRDCWTRDVVNREIMGSDYIKILNPDPVFLLNDFCVDKWETSITKGSYYIVTLPCGITGWERYMIKKWLRVLREKLHQDGLILVELPLPEGVSGFEEFDITVPYPIDPLQWFLWLKNAKAFIGLRFHAVVSCISAGTPFFSLDVYGHIPRWLSYLNRVGVHRWDRKLNTGSKIRNLLEGSGLEDYRINGALPIGLSPNKIVKMFDNFDMKSLIVFRDKNKALFKEHMIEALS
jgi:hypothetical protein